MSRKLHGLKLASRILLLTALVATLLQAAPPGRAALPSDPLIIPLGESGSHSGPWPSPYGGFVYGRSSGSADDPYQITRIDDDGNEMWRVVEDRLDAYNPAFAPDGTVYFVGTRGSSDAFSVASISPTGTVRWLHTWENSPSDFGQVVFGRDGNLYAYHGAYSCMALQRLDRSTGEPTTVSEYVAGTACSGFTIGARAEEIVAIDANGVAIFYPYNNLAAPIKIDNPSGGYYSTWDIGADGAVHMYSRPRHFETCADYTLSRRGSGGTSYAKPLSDLFADAGLSRESCSPIAISGRPDGSSVLTLESQTIAGLDLISIGPDGAIIATAPMPAPSRPDAYISNAHSAADAAGNTVLLADIRYSYESRGPRCSVVQMRTFNSLLATIADRTLGTAACSPESQDFPEVVGGPAIRTGVIAGVLQRHYGDFYSRELFLASAPVVTDGGAPPPEFKYVALGDSFSSGEGTYHYPDSERCHRGPGAWPRLMDLGSSAIESVIHKACTGAKTTQLVKDTCLKYERVRGKKKCVRRARAQIPSKPDPSVDLVTFTIGGNNVGFKSTLIECRVPIGDCAGAPDRQDFKNAITALKQKLISQVYPRLESAYPNARLVHVGYPRIFPPPSEAAVNCNWLEPGEQVAVERMLGTLNNAIADAADTSARVEFALVTTALKDHELCTEDDPWVVPITHYKGEALAERTEQAHPDIQGQDAYARSVASALGIEMLD